MSWRRRRKVRVIRDWFLGPFRPPEDMEETMTYIAQLCAKEEAEWGV